MFYRHTYVVYVARCADVRLSEGVSFAVFLMRALRALFFTERYSDHMKVIEINIR